MEILVTILYIIACVLMFALAILIHEFGHFVVALKLGLRVEAFSIGFGPALWKKKINGVEYRISALPLGGYVSIPDVDPEGTKALEGGGKADVEAKAKIPAWKEVLVALAGPIMNIVLALILAVVLSLVPSVEFGQLPAKIGMVIKEGPADKAGMKAGDVVKSIDGVEVNCWTDMMTEVQIGGGRTMDFEVVGDDGVPRIVKIQPEHEEITGGWYIKALSCASENGRAHNWLPHRNPIKQVMWDAGSIFRVLKALVTPRDAKATSKALGGPVMIAEGLYRQVRRDPWDGIGFLRFLNVNLAVFNLLPIPVLDGGLILFALFALIFKRRVPATVIKGLSMTFMILLLALMGILIYRDSFRSYRLHTYKPTSTENAQSNTDTSAESR